MRLTLALLFALAGNAFADDCHSRFMIVLDRSCSMNMPPQKGGTQTKWELAGLALQKVTTKYMGQLDFGLIMFPDQTGNCVQDGPIYVNVAPGNESTVVSTVMSTMPTAPCVTDIKPAFDQVSKDPAFATPYASGPRGFVLFISDGMQTCGGGVNQIAASVKALYDNGYPSYIVGFGDGVAPAALDQFATAGGVPRIESVDGGTSVDMAGHLYYQADDATALDDALDHIVGAVASEFSICPGIPCPDNRCYQASAQCQNGFCILPPTDDGGTSTSGTTGATTGTTGTTGGGGDGGTNSNGGSNGGRATGGCGCRLGGDAPLAPLALLLIAFVAIRARSRKA